MGYDEIIAATSPYNYVSDKGDKSADANNIRSLIKDGKFSDALDIISDKKLAKNTFETLLTYNSSFEGLEPVYFWILDFMGGKPEKLIDNFQSSPGSGHFSDLMGKATRMQEEAMKVMQTMGVLIKSIINIIYDLRQFKLSLNDYAAANSKGDDEQARAGLIALKQKWLDNVDIKRGNTSIKGLTFSQASFATLLDAFFAVKNLKSFSDKKNIPDLNERVIRILEQRLLEFEKWRELSELELTKRYNIEKAWLRSQVDSLKLYARWAKPYFLAAEQLRMKGESSASLVTAFNTITMQIVLMDKNKINVEESVVSRELPKGFEKIKNLRDYYACRIVDFSFRGIPQRSEQHYTFGGKVDVKFKAFALNEEELLLFKDRFEQSDLKDALKLVDSAVGDSLKEIEDDLEEFLGEDNKKAKDEKKKKEVAKSGDINPFSALFGNLFTGNNWLSFNSSKSGQSKDEKKSQEKEKIKILLEKGIKPDNFAEKAIRALAMKKAKDSTFSIYDIYKKAHGMASVPFLG